MRLELSLQDLGLTRNESKVYLALLKLGQVTTSKIQKETKLNTSRIYESLNSLLEKGVVSYSIVKNKKHWACEEEDSLLKYVDAEIKKIEKRKKVYESIKLELSKRRNKDNSVSPYKIYEGIKGIKVAREKVLEILEPGETFYIILANYPSDKKFEGHWLDFQKRRAKKGINCKYLYNEDLREEFGKKREDLDLTQIRYVQSESLSHTWVEIYGDYVAIGVLKENPSLFIVHDKQTAKGFKEYFNFMWNSAKE